MNILIKNANIVDANKNIKGDIYIEDGIIKEIGNLNKDCKIIDANSLTLMPSFIDMHTHLRDPGFTYKEDLESGQRAALKGGYTHLCPMANTNPVCDNEDVMKYIKNKSFDLNLCDIHQVCSITKGMQGKEFVDFKNMINYTTLFSEDGKNIDDENIMKNALIESKKNNFIVLTHCDEEDVIIKRDLKLLEKEGGNLHICHISLKESLNAIKEYKDKGIKVTCEVTPHHLFANDMDYKVNPPIASKEDKQAMINGIKDGYIDMIGTDHAPHSKEDKEKGAPGICNIEVAFSMVYKALKENDISLNTLSRVMSYNPAKLLNINTGLIKEGYEANLVLVDLEKEYEINTDNFISKSKNNPFNGQKVLGEVVATIKRGEILYDNR